MRDSGKAGGDAKDFDNSGITQVSAPAADHDLGPLMAGFSQDFSNLKAEFDRLLGNLSASVHDATELTLEHTALYDTAVGELQTSTEQAVATAQQLAQRCIVLSKELRGTDLLAERTRRLRKSVEALESQVNRIL
ncbi:g1894 [Coccomyxa viridis]|uniref:G1894 protein n=1 Tax=Coccomyxa viridis TaxID=1274662 RepID=A0ABP1FMX0_9CHLO